MALMPLGVVHIGAWKIGEGDLHPVNVSVKTEAEGKVDKKESDGKDDATATWKGRKVASIDISLSWDARDTAVNDKMFEVLTDLSPRGPKGGEGFEYAERCASVHGIKSILIEKITGPNTEAGTSETKAEIKGGSWTKPAAKGPAAGKTPTSPQKWVEAATDGTNPLGKTGNKVGGFGNQDTKPAVKP